jgi:hypothetical protein
VEICVICGKETAEIGILAELCKKSIVGKYKHARLYGGGGRGQCRFYRIIRNEDENNLKR